jgi:hypothetical protein
MVALSNERSQAFECKETHKCSSVSIVRSSSLFSEFCSSQTAFAIYCATMIFGLPFTGSPGWPLSLSSRGADNDVKDCGEGLVKDYGEITGISVGISVTATELLGS